MKKFFRFLSAAAFAAVRVSCLHDSKRLSVYPDTPYARRGAMGTDARSSSRTKPRLMPLKKMRYLLSILCLPASILCMASCMDYGPAAKEDFDFSGGSDGQIGSGSGLFITCEGNFMYGNASLSFYDPGTKKIENEVFARANGIKLGDVAHSMVIRDGIGWIVVNNSGILFAIDVHTFKEIGRITGFTSPRYIHFLSDEKAYVTQLWDPRIYIIHPKTFEITGYVETDMSFKTGSTEQMVQYGKYVFTNCWSYQNRILVIDTETDEVCDQITVGIQPTSLVMDKNNKIWTVTDGGYAGSPYGHEAPSLYRIDAATRKVEKQFRFEFGDSPSELTLNGTRDTLYFINNDVWRLPVTADRFPLRPFIKYKETIFYGLTIDPLNSEVYVADAIDYVQPGVILRYSPEGELLDEFKVGIIPGSFCWK